MTFMTQSCTLRSSIDALRKDLPLMFEHPAISVICFPVAQQNLCYLPWFSRRLRDAAACKRLSPSMLCAMFKAVSKQLGA
jgi:hypothetical protein